MSRTAKTSLKIINFSLTTSTSTSLVSCFASAVLLLLSLSFDCESAMRCIIIARKKVKQLKFPVATVRHQEWQCVARQICAPRLDDVEIIIVRWNKSKLPMAVKCVYCTLSCVLNASAQADV